MGGIRDGILVSRLPRGLMKFADSWVRIRLPRGLLRSRSTSGSSIPPLTRCWRTLSSTIFTLSSWAEYLRRSAKQIRSRRTLRCSHS